MGFHGNGGEWVYRVPDAPVFHPTEEEFKDPMRYIQSIQSEASRWGEFLQLCSGNILQVQFTPVEHTKEFRFLSFVGICKIVPPVTPATPAAMVRFFQTI